MDAVALEVCRHRLAALCEEMGATLGRCAHSPNIKERRDYSCALFDPAGELVAQAAHIPVHLGAMPLSVAAALRRHALQPGDVVLVNDPFEGGSHLPDWTVLSGVFVAEQCVALVANRAHHADVGGARPGSMGAAGDVFAEGQRVPPVKLVRAGRVDTDLEALLLANTRTPEERRGDLAAQLAALRCGEQRTGELATDLGPAGLAAAMAALLDYTERVSRATLAALPDGTWCSEDRLDDGAAIRCRLTLAGPLATVDLTASDPQQPGAFNAPRAVAVSATLYALACLLPPGTPINAGLARPVTVLTRPGSLVDAQPPAAVNAGNVETSQRLVDVLLDALAAAAPERVPAAGQGTMNNVLIGGQRRDGTPFTYYETVCGGMGAGPHGDGLSATQVHMTNTLNTPAEALEYAYPLRVERYELRDDSGGAGRYRGGDGVVRAVRLLVEAEVTLLGSRRNQGPPGRSGGEAGAPGSDTLVSRGERLPLPATAAQRVPGGTVLEVATPGGGGWGVSNATLSDPAPPAPSGPAPTPRTASQ